MTEAEFLDRYPEFASDSSEPLASILAEAANRLERHRARFAERFDEALGAYAADKVWGSAFGLSLRLDETSEGKRSKYGEHYDAIWEAVRATARARSSTQRGW